MQPDDLKPPPSRYSEGEHEFSRMQYPRARRNEEGRETVPTGKHVELCPHCGKRIGEAAPMAPDEDCVLINGPSNGKMIALPSDMTHYVVLGSHYTRTEFKDDKGRVIYTYSGQSSKPMTEALQTK